MTYYLAHPTKHRFYVRDVVQQELENTGIEITNPFRTSPERERLFFDKKYQNDMVSMMEEEQKKEDFRKIVLDEMNYIRRAHGVIAYMPCESIGTAMEIFFNSYTLGRGPQRTHTLIDIPEGTPEEYIRQHPWLFNFSTVSEKLEQLVERVHQYESEH